jgi:hypothetical protein
MRIAFELAIIFTLHFPCISHSTLHIPHSTKKSNLKTKTMKKDTWKFIIQMIVAILTAIATSLGVTACIC